MTTPRQPGMSIGTYRLLGPLGHGGVGEVWRARDSKLDRLVALKFLRDPPSKNLIRLFQKEAQALARLQHPNIVTIFAVGSDQNIPYIVMEYISGYNLDHLIQNGKIRISWAVRIAQQISLALQYLHGQSIVHGDIKPSNILVQENNDIAKLSDFGLATRRDSRTDAIFGRGVFGSVWYMAPEQIAEGQTSIHSDIYSFGVALYELFTGKLPHVHDASSVVPSVAKIVPPVALRPEIPQKLSSTILEMLRSDPKDRLASLEPLMQVLGEICQTTEAAKGNTLTQRAIERTEVRTRQDNLTEVAAQSSSGFFDASVFSQTRFFQDDSVRFSKIQETLEFYRAHLNEEYLSLLRQATLTYRLWLGCVAFGFLILLVGVGTMLSGRITQGAATAASTTIVYFIQRVFQQREDHYRSLARAKNAHLEYGNQWLLVIQSIDSIEDPEERARRQAKLVEVLTARLSDVTSSTGAA